MASGSLLPLRPQSASIPRPCAPPLVPACRAESLANLFLVRKDAASQEIRTRESTNKQFHDLLSLPVRIGRVVQESRKRKSSTQRGAVVQHEARHPDRNSACCCRGSHEGPQRSSKVDGHRSVEELAERAGEVNSATVMLPAHLDCLSSVGNAFVKHVVKLRQSSSYRHACGSVVIVGDIPLRELCEVGEVSLANVGRQPLIDCLLVAENSKIPEVIENFSKRVVRVTSAVMHKLSGLDSVEGVQAVGVVPFPASFLSLEQTRDYLEALSNWCPCPERLLVLDAVQDPGNLGTLLRTAAAFDWDGVFLANGCCDPFNEKALRASRGACFRIPIASGQWSQLRTFADLKEIKLYAGEPQCCTLVTPQGEGKQAVFEAHSHSKQGLFSGWNGEQKQGSFPRSVDHLQETEALCLVLGSEGQGLSEEARAVCNLISIPMQGRFESLNVAVAGGILLFTLQKMKRKN